MTVYQAIQDKLSGRTYAPRTMEYYARLTRLVQSHPLAWLPADARSREAAQSLINAQLVAGHGRTAEQLYVFLRFVSPSMMDGLKRPRFARRAPCFLTVEDARRILAIDSPYWLAWALALSCGLRRGELCGLRWSDVDMEHCIIHVRNQRVRIKGKGLIDLPPKSEDGFRDLPIPGHLAEALAQAYIVAQADALLSGQNCPYVLAGPLRRGCDPNALDRAFQAACRAAGVQCTLHGLRHTMASIGANAGVPMRVLQTILGHSNYTTTARYYTHSYSDAVGRALESVQTHLQLPTI